jgi:hypothetical protein
MVGDEQIQGLGTAFPVRLTNQGQIAFVGGAEKVRQSILLILGTEPGERLMRPDFGCHFRNLVFEPNSTSIARLAEFQVRDALLRWEPRIEVEFVAVDSRINGEYGSTLSIQVHYRIKENGIRDRLQFELPVA